MRLKIIANRTLTSRTPSTSQPINKASRSKEQEDKKKQGRARTKANSYS
jgi:hypothetical protein